MTTFFLPSTLVGFIFLVGLGIAFFYKSISRIFLVSGAVFFIVMGFFPIGYNAVHYWETRHSSPDQLLPHVDGIIVLGGATETDLSEIHGIYSLNDSGDRLSHFAALALQYPQAKRIFTGGGSGRDYPEDKEAYHARIFFQSLGLPIEEFYFEDNSHNTYENVMFSKEMVSPEEGETWLLVTSAFHMPRSIAVFRAQGWDVVPYPVDFKTGSKYKIWPSLEVIRNLRLMDIGFKEAIGLAGYKVTGKIK